MVCLSQSTGYLQVLAMTASVHIWGAAKPVASVDGAIKSLPQQAFKDGDQIGRYHGLPRVMSVVTGLVCCMSSK